ncbi:carboxypeptidase regulatory-like domain-containing protein [Chitinophaga defluvii]|uniref:Carboxypeptidase regulatory-like domain-containing protein n=1 Tax=Chitinophaga defluvii TaxID=3163343 RepID=A0ABV2T935_9BACT
MPAKLLSLLFLLLCFFATAQTTSRLQQRVSVVVTHGSLEELLTNIQQRYNISFSYVRQLIPLQHKVTVRANGQPLSTVLQQALQGTGITFHEAGTQIILSPPLTAAKNDSTYTQTVQGTVMDKALLLPIAGATVMITSLPGKGTVTDENGRFQIMHIPVGRHEIQVRSIGYQTAQIPNVLVISGKQTLLPITLEESALLTREVQVKAPRLIDKDKTINPLANVSTRIVLVEEANRFAGTRADPSRMAANYAGVANLDDRNNDIIVRGNNPFGILWRVEGIDIPNPNHYTYINTSGGAFGVLNNNLLANSDFMSGAFPAEYGNKIAAVYDVRLREGNPEKHEFNAQAGLNGLELNAEGPVSQKQESSYLIGYRLLNYGMLQHIGVDLNIDGAPKFQDLTFKLHFRDQGYGALTLFGLGGKSRISFQEKVTDTRGLSRKVVNNYSQFTSDMGVLGMHYEHSFSAHTTGRLAAALSGSYIMSKRDLEYIDHSRLKDFEGMFREQDTYLSYTLTHKWNSRHLLKAGISYMPRHYRYFLTKLVSDTSNAYMLNIDDQVTMKLLQGYVHWQYQLTPALTFNTGLHYQHLFYNHSQALEPRFSAEWRINEQHRLKAGYGLHHQMQPVYMYINRNYNRISQTYTPANSQLGFTGSHHTILEYDYSCNKYLRFKTAAYYQHLFKVPVTVSPSFYSAINEGLEHNDYVPDTLVNKGLGRNYGIEFTIEKFLHRHYYFLLTTSLYNSQYRTLLPKWYNSTYNGNYIINFCGGVEIPVGKQSKNALSLDGRIIQAGNKRQLPIDLAASRKARVIVVAADGFYANRYQDYSRIDFKISYRINRQKATHQFFVAADNLLGKRNVLGNWFSPHTGDITTDHQMGLFPYAGYKVAF